MRECIKEHFEKHTGLRTPRIICNDGFSYSVQRILDIEQDENMLRRSEVWRRYEVWGFNKNGEPITRDPRIKYLHRIDCLIFKHGGQVGFKR